MKNILNLIVIWILMRMLTEKVANELNKIASGCVFLNIPFLQFEAHFLLHEIFTFEIADIRI